MGTLPNQHPAYASGLCTISMSQPLAGFTILYALPVQLMLEKLRQKTTIPANGGGLV